MSFFPGYKNEYVSAHRVMIRYSQLVAFIRAKIKSVSRPLPDADFALPCQKRSGLRGTVTIMDRTGRKPSVAYCMAIARHFFGADWSYHERVQPEQNVSGGDHNSRLVTYADWTTPIRCWCYT